jgi:hypothetical protein
MSKETHLMHGTIELCVELSPLSSFNYKSEIVPVSHEGSSSDVCETFVGVLFQHRLAEAV